LQQKQTYGNLLQWSSSEFLCIDCDRPGHHRSAEASLVGLYVCDQCFDFYLLNVRSVGDEKFGVKLFYPHQIVLVDSVELNDAVRSAIDFQIGSVDRNRSRWWKKRLQKMLLRNGERNF
jgi:hypothetical protein